MAALSLKNWLKLLKPDRAGCQAGLEETLKTKLEGKTTSCKQYHLFMHFIVIVYEIRS
jgi:hypothetical protein